MAAAADRLLRRPLKSQSLDGYEPFDFGDFFFQMALHAHLQRHRRAGAALAGAFQPHGDDAGCLVEADQLNIAAVRLKKRADV